MGLKFKGKVGIATGQAGVIRPELAKENINTAYYEAVGVQGEIKATKKINDKLLLDIFDVQAKYALGLFKDGSKHSEGGSCSLAKISWLPFGKGLILNAAPSLQLNFHQFPDKKDKDRSGNAANYY